MGGERVERRLAAVLAADIAGYSRLMGADEKGTLAQLKAVRKAVVDPAILSHRGRIVKTTGDGMVLGVGPPLGGCCCLRRSKKLMIFRRVCFSMSGFGSLPIALANRVDVDLVGLALPVLCI